MAPATDCIQINSQEAINSQPSPTEAPPLTLSLTLTEVQVGTSDSHDAGDKRREQEDLVAAGRGQATRLSATNLS